VSERSERTIEHGFGLPTAELAEPAAVISAAVRDTPADDAHDRGEVR